jgi:GntR family transcriptional repressor for pyruvate dehydrogenase complex
MTFGEMPRSSLAQEITSRLLLLIRERQLVPGEKLPPERELAAIMQVSRPVLREALRALAIMNVLEIRHGAGTYITSLEPKRLVEHLDFVFSLDDSTFLSLFEARKIVETGVVTLAAQRISDGDLEELDKCLADGISHVNDIPRFVEADLRLHEIVNRAANNPMLSRFMDSIGALSRASRMRTVEIRGVREETIEHHKQIVTALRAHDPQAARKAMANHLDFIEERLKEVEVRGRG